MTRRLLASTEIAAARVQCDDCGGPGGVYGFRAMDRRTGEPVDLTICQRCWRRADQTVAQDTPDSAGLAALLAVIIARRRARLSSPVPGNSPEPGIRA